jgi:hypothetical protein
MIDRFILDYQGIGDKPIEDVERFGSLPGVEIIDDTLPRTLILQGPVDILSKEFRTARNWVVIPRTSYCNPEPFRADNSRGNG